ncbi:helix-turn-helix transcriptional regulator [Paenibacillus sp. FSL W8-0919]|uniref:helix-turn-helix domain-containing protein n=1 Tax=Paenibacillus sp. FSL W8-0919 TaxID=2954707 RepID=UPI0030F5C82E
MKINGSDGNKRKKHTLVQSREELLARELPHDPDLLEMYLNQQREKFIQASEAEWAVIACHLREDRLNCGISLADAATMTGFSSSTLRKFEKGSPVRNARVIGRSYEMMLLIETLQSELTSAFQYIDELTMELREMKLLEKD